MMYPKYFYTSVIVFPLKIVCVWDSECMWGGEGGGGGGCGKRNQQMQQIYVYVI
jgi:hypothetical protein